MACPTWGPAGPWPSVCMSCLLLIANSKGHAHLHGNLTDPMVNAECHGQSATEANLSVLESHL